MTFRRLIYLIIAPVALWMLTACQSDVDEPEVGENAMIFTPEIASRAALISQNNLTGSPFAVFGDMLPISDTDNSHLVKIHNATEVRYDGSQWTYDETSFWIPGYQHSFIALYPANAPGYSDMTYADSQVKFTYSYPLDDYRRASDLLIASHRRNYYEGATTSPVTFRFGHILSNYNIRVSYVDPSITADKMVVTGVTFKDIPTKATFAVTPAPLAGGSSMTSDYVYDSSTMDAWTVDARGDLEIKFTGDDVREISKDGEKYPLFTDSDALMLLPNKASDQKTPVPTQMILYYTTFETPEGQPRTAEITIPDGWSSGRNYTLSLTINKGAVKFSIEVTDWQPGSSTSTTVPRK